MDKHLITRDFREIQDYICRELEMGDGTGSFHEDKWERAEGGGGRTRIFKNGKIIEKGGVAFSAVEGPTPQKILNKLQLDKADFFATGVSIVIHPFSPMVPIIHMNIRYFEMSNGIRWFGGGIDLTPHYVDLEDAKYFHHAVKKTCDL
ncbi:coproporphyrinogen III oxidase, partial [Aquiflexum sp.]|uniref:coproporphyrinogen III oxidase n=1 Tax=Aquiflexum sp. TaxID=1872584 RepID=UPI003593FFA8